MPIYVHIVMYDLRLFVVVCKYIIVFTDILIYSAAQWQLNERTRATRVYTRFSSDAHLQTGHVLNVNDVPSTNDYVYTLSYDNRSHHFRLWSLVKAVFSSVYAQRLSAYFCSTWTRVSHTCEMHSKRVRNACDC